MRILRTGVQGHALAPGRGHVPVVYRYRTVKLEKTGVEVPNVLVGVCPETDEILTVPAQSTPKLKAARDAAKGATLQVRLPEALRDVLFLIAEHYRAESTKFWPALLRFYLSELLRDSRLATRVARLAGSGLANDGPTTRFALRARSELVDDLDRLAESSGVRRSDLVRGAIVAAKEDVLDRRAPGRADKLDALARGV